MRLLIFFLSFSILSSCYHLNFGNTGDFDSPEFYKSRLLHLLLGLRDSQNVPKFQVGGSLTGVTRSGLVLRSDLGEELTIPLGGTNFQFQNKFSEKYEITIAKPATGLLCEIENGKGSITADVNNVTVNCILGGNALGLVRTGQTICYDALGNSVTCTSSGQDGEHLKTLSRNLQAQSDGTVLDLNTQLIWQKCSMGQTASSCAGTETTPTLADGTTYCNGLGKGFRVPTIQELSGLVHYGVTSPPRIDSTSLFGIKDFSYYSTTRDPAGSTLVYLMNFDTGRMISDHDYIGYRIQCVKGNVNSVSHEFKDQGDGTVLDTSTQLVWQKCTNGQNNDSTCSGSATTSSWIVSLSNCSSLSLAGKTWRLPNQNELLSLSDLSNGSTKISSLFPNTIGDYYWSSTSFAGGATNAMVVKFDTGLAESISKSATPYYSRCVTGP